MRRKRAPARHMLSRLNDISRRMRHVFRLEREWVLVAPLLVSGFVFGWFAFQPAPPDPALEAARDAQIIGSSEHEAITAFLDILRENRAGTLSDLDAADRVERDVLSIWKKARQRIAIARARPQWTFYSPEIDEYFRLRQESWEALIAAVRNRDERAMAVQRAKWQSADAIVIKLRARGTPSAPPQ